MNYNEPDRMKYFINNLQKNEKMFLNVTDTLLDDDFLDIEDLFPENTLKSTYKLSELKELIKDKNIIEEAEIIEL